MRYRERLWVPWWWWPLGFALATIIGLEINQGVPSLPRWLPFAVLFVVAAGALLWLGRIEIRVTDPERGTFIHEALDRFVREGRPGADLIAIGRDVFGDALARPGVWAFWWPRFERIAAWFVATEIDYAWTYVGASFDAINAALADDRLEALPARLTDLPFADADTINAALDPQP